MSGLTAWSFAKRIGREFSSPLRSGENDKETSFGRAHVHPWRREHGD